MEMNNIKKLSNMARIDMDEIELNEIAKSFDSILSYVGQIQEISSSNEDIDKVIPNTPYNITRDDTITNLRAEYTDKILKEMPKQEDGFLKVKQIL